MAQVLATVLWTTICATIIGYVTSEILMQPGEVLHWLHRLLYKVFTREVTVSVEVPEELKGRVSETKIEKKTHWLYKPLGGCVKCFAGQIAMWVFLHQSIILKYYYKYDSIFVVTNHLLTVCLTILITKIMVSISQKWLK